MIINLCTLSIRQHNYEVLLKSFLSVGARLQQCKRRKISRKKNNNNKKRLKSFSLNKSLWWSLRHEQTKKVSFFACLGTCSQQASSLHSVYIISINVYVLRLFPFHRGYELIHIHKRKFLLTFCLHFIIIEMSSNKDGITWLLWCSFMSQYTSLKSGTLLW